MKKKKKIFLCTIIILFSFWILVSIILGIWTKLASDGRVNLSFFLTIPGARILNFEWKISENPLLRLKTNGPVKVPWKSFLFGTNQLLAFQAPATIKLPEGKSKINFSGEIQGNFKKGEVNIKDTKVWLEKFGTMFVSGRLVQWGKEFCEIEGNVKNFAIDELRNVLEIQNLPFSGIITGKLSITINKDVVKQLRFDIDFSKLSFRQQSSPLSGHVKGSYDILAKKCLIDNANIITQSGGRLFVKGTISQEDFSLKIESEGVNLDEIISQLPEKWQEKFKASSKISMNAEGSWQKNKELPLFSGFISLPGNIQYKNFSCSNLMIKNNNENNEIFVEAEKIEIWKMRCDEIKGKIIRENERYKGNINFSLYDGTGNILFTTSEQSPVKFYGKIDISKLNLKKLVQSLHPEIVVTGLVNVICFIESGKGDFSLQAKVDNVPARPFSQKLNISAVKALASLGSSSFAGSIGKRFGGTDFYYRKLGGVISIINGYLTIEGTAKRAGENDYLVTSEIFGSGINVLVDRNNNSIKIEDLKNRIERAMQQNKPQFKLSFLKEAIYGKTNYRFDCWTQVMLS